MKRKHTPGCYCCAEQTCYELQEADLPDVALENWTHSGWVGNACCKCLTLTPVSPVESVTCSSDYGTADIDVECNWNLRAITNRKPAIFGSETCPIPDDVCCDGPVINIGTGQSAEYLHRNYRVLFRYIPAKIDVCISKQDVDCDGVISEKYVVLSRYCYDVQVYSVMGFSQVVDLETTLTDSCFRKRGALDTSAPCDAQSEIIREAPCAIEDLNSNYDILLFSGQACFERVKFLDDPPDGELGFDNTDDGSGCTWQFCESGFEYTTEFCYEVAAFAGRPCQCDYGWTLTEQTTTTNIGSACGCDTCVETLTAGTNYTRIISCDPFEDALECCAGDSCGSTCYSYNTTCYVAEWDAEPENPCGEPDFGFYCGSGCNKTPCALLKSVAEDSDCYWSGPCGPAVGKYTVIANDATSASWTIDCNFIGPVEFCIPAPSWTLNFT